MYTNKFPALPFHPRTMESDEELELLLAFQSVPETPPASPPRINEKGSMDAEGSSDSRAATPQGVRATLQEVFGYSSDDDGPSRNATMEAFRDVVRASSKAAEHHVPHAKHPPLGAVNRIEVEVHSGLRIRNRSVSSVSLSNRLSDLRFVPLQAIRSATMGENIKGAWATVGVLAEKGSPKVSSNGKDFAIWKIASLDTATISLFLFGDAYTQHCKELAGCIIAVFNAKVRHDNKRNEFSLSIFASDQLLKLGTSVDYCVCKGLRKDGTPCSIVVNRRRGEYCQYHSSAMRQKYKSKRGELNGGNLGTGLSFLQKPKVSQGTRGLFDSGVGIKSEKPVKHMSLKGLKTILSNAEKVTTKYQSQGIRCLASLADGNNENVDPKRQNGNQHGHLQKRIKLDKRGKLTSSQQLGKNKSKESVDQHQLTSSRQLGKKKNKESVDQQGLIELDLEEPDDDAMAQAMVFFGKGGLLR